MTLGNIGRKNALKAKLSNQVVGLVIILSLGLLL